MKIENGTTVIRAMFRSGLSATYSDARRCIKQNAVRVDGATVAGLDAVIDFGGNPQLTIQVGKRRQHIFVQGDSH